MSSDQLAIAIALTRSGEKEAARELLLRIIKEEPQNEMAWMWLVDTQPGDAERIATLEQCLNVNPNSQLAQNALAVFRARQPAPPPVQNPFLSTDDSGSQVAETEQTSQAAFTEQPPLETLPAQELPSAVAMPEPPLPSEETSQPPAEPLPPKKSQKLKPRKRKRSVLRTFGVVVLILFLLALLGGAIWLGAGYMSQVTTEKIASEQATAAFLQAQIKAQETAAPTISTSQLKALTLTAQPQIQLPSNQAGPAILPFPLYFISNKSGSDQVWRSEYDGKTLTQVSKEDAPVTGLDVSQYDGSLAYVSGNNLIVANASGNERRVLVAGDDLASVSADDLKTRQISDPLWSPDGARLAYRLNGVNVVKPMDENKPINLVTDGPEPANVNTGSGTPTPMSTATSSDASTGVATETADNPNDTDEDTPEGPLTYRPVLWSPDGTRVVTQAISQTDQSLAIFSAVGGKSIYLEGFSSCCEMTWSLDSKYLYLANAKLMSTDPALMRIDTRSGEITSLIPSQEGNKYNYLRWPQMASSGQLYFFEGFQSNTASQPLLLSSSAGEKMENITQVYKSGSYTLVDNLWSPDLSMAIVQDSNQTGLQLLYTDGRPPLPLNISGHNFRWGSQSTTVSIAPAVTPAPTTVSPQEALRQKYIGLQYPPPPDEVETTGSQKIASDADHYGLTMTRSGDVNMLWLEKFVNKDKSGINHVEVKDVIVIPGLSGDTLWDFTSCTLNGNPDADVFALGSRKDASTPVTIYAAWLVNQTDYTFVQLYASGVQCSFEKTE